MASFITDLWESIFTPGPTPVLLRATNISFAALQVTLFALLVATYSVHFVALSVLCAGLWYSINWFSAELAAAKARGDIPSGNTEDEKPDSAAATSAVTGPPEGESSDTEVEGRATRSKSKGKRKGGAGAVGRADVEPVDVQGDVKHRSADSRLSQSSVSTEDEWEKVSGSEQDKDK
ncbi:SMK killer toxin resistance protein [Lecanicillium sp. MT-2017a]|nr:SMK killer toxin resistance protein [Lecanicillium sp. MT-2017a]